MSISEAAKLQDRVRREALLDLYILSRCEQLAAAASSMFAVAGRLWGVGHAAARGVEQAGSSGGYRGAQRRGAAWTDLDEVVSGELATGFLRGMRNGTERLVDGSERHAVALSRMLGRKASRFVPKLTFDASTAIPLFFNATFHSATSIWSSTAAPPSAGHWCACDPTLAPAPCDPHAGSCEPSKLGCDAAELTNLGVELYDGFVMNYHGAEACWRRALMIPGRTKHAGFTTAQPAADVSDVARGNLIALMGKLTSSYGRYSKLASKLRQRGGGGGGSGLTEEDAVQKGGGDPFDCEQEEEETVSAAGDEPEGGRRRQTRTRDAGHRVRLHVEGWRDVPHSYSVAAVALVQELATRCDVDISWSDAPHPAGFEPALRTSPMTLPSRVRVLPFGTSPESLPPPLIAASGAPSSAELGRSTERRAVILRMTWPYNLSKPVVSPGALAAFKRRTKAGKAAKPPLAPAALVFATAEHLTCPGGLLEGSPSWSQASAAPVFLLTPSEWSLEGLVTCGMPRGRIAVAPHGVGPWLLSSEAAERAATVRAAERRRRGWEGRFVLLHVGAATPNKNLDGLLAAYAEALKRILRARLQQRAEDAQGAERQSRQQLLQKQRILRPLLVLKGLDGLYGSGHSARAAVEKAFGSPYMGKDASDLGGSEGDDEGGDEGDGSPLHAARYVQLIGDDLSSEGMASLYRASDAYVSASMAEAFQIPLAEATAAGLPVIAPAGGAAEEVCDPYSATFVPSIVQDRRSENPKAGMVIRVDHAALVAALEKTLLNRTDARTPPATSPAAHGPRWAERFLSVRYSADRVLAAVMKAAVVGA